MNALDTWRQRREFIIEKLALAQGTAKFILQKELEEADAMIAQLEAAKSGSSTEEAGCPVDVIQVSQYATDFVGHFPGETVRGPAGIRSSVLAHRASFPDWTETVEGTIAEGDRVVTKFRSRGTNRC